MLRSSRLTGPLAVLALSLALPTLAQAKNYCVGDPGGSCDGGDFAFTAQGFAAALGSATGDSSPSTVRIAQGTISGLASVNISSSVMVVGAGRDKTILESAQVNGGALVVLGNDNGLTDLTFRTTQVTSSTTIANVQNGAVLERVKLQEASPAPTAQPVVALRLTNASAADVTVTTNSTNDQGIIMVGTGSLTNVDVSGTGIFGIDVNDPNTSRAFDRVRVTGLYSIGMQLRGSTALLIRDTLLDLTATGAVGMEVSASPGDANFILASRTSVIGRGANQVGVRITTSSANQNSSVDLRDSVVDLSNGVDLVCDIAGGGTPDLRSARSAFRTIQRDAGCTGTATSIRDLTATPPLYRDAAARDWRPAWNSPLVDAGNTTTPNELLDLLGQPRFVDGNGTGGAAVDLGAFEYQRAAPTAPVITAPALSATTAGAFSATATDPDGDPLTYAWTFGDGDTGSGAAPSHAYAAPGDYLVSVSVTDPTGRTATSNLTVTVSAAPPSPSPTAVPTPTPSPTSRPGGSVGLTVLPRIKLLRAPTRATKRSARGFRVTATSPRTAAQLQTENGATQLRLSLTRLTPGRRTGSRCRAAATTGKRCTVRTALPGAATVAPRTGSFGLSFGGTFAGKRLKAGTYEVSVVPSSPSGGIGTGVSFRISLR